MTINVTVQLTTMNCGKCGGVYAITEKYRANAYENSGSWNCPYCKVNWGYGAGNGKHDELKKEVDRLNKNLDYVRGERDKAVSRASRIERQRRSQKAATTKLRKQLEVG